MKKDARLIAMELRNWLNKKEYTLEELNRATVVLRNGLLKNLNHVEFKYSPPEDDFKSIKKYFKPEEYCQS
jgi:hypothetical protein